jgi:hydroxyacylglutathione hydrolase
MATAAAKGRSAKPVADAYFDAIARRDLDGLAACWAPDGVDRLIGFGDLPGPEGVRGFFGELFGAFPDFDLQVQQTVAQSGRVAVHWKATGTFAGPGTLQGLQPTGARVEFEGIDVLHVADGVIVRNDAVSDQLSLARQIGLMPAMGSPIQERMTRAFNTRTRVTQKAVGGDTEQIADGVWLLRGGWPQKWMNVYLLEEPGGGVTVFDAGARQMSGAIAAAGAALGGIQRVVLSHAHPDHRGAAPTLRAPVFCHPADRADAEGDGGVHYFDYSRLRIPARWTLQWLLEKGWDGGPVEIAGTLDEGDEVAGFRVVHLPGHAPGMIALFRDSDRLALTADAFYTLNVEWSLRCAPRLPHEAFNPDTEQARASLRKLAALEPSVAWPAHANAATGDVRAQLERAAAG